MRLRILAIVLACVPATAALALTSTTVTYQQDANGYTDSTQMRISMTASRDGTDGNATTTYYLIDGWRTDDPITPEIETDSPDEQELIRFANIFGNGAGQIPLGATILGSTLTYRTYDTGTSPPSPGPWGVAALLQPFTSATRYADFPSSNGNPLLPSRGAWFQDGQDQPIGHPYATRAVGGFGGTSTNTLGAINDADVFPIIQQWSNDPTGMNNYGFVVQAGWTGETNGWGFFTNGTATVGNRPKLSVTYTTSPIGVATFQRDLNGYTGDTVVRLSSGADLINSADDITIDGSTATGSYYYVDEMDSSASTHLRALMKFDNVFGSNPGQAPADKTVTKAWLAITTGVSDDNRSPGPFSVHPMLRDWDTTTLYSSFGAVPGLQEADGDIGAVLDSNLGMINGAESWFDVTSYLEAIRNGRRRFWFGRPSQHQQWLGDHAQWRNGRSRTSAIGCLLRFVAPRRSGRLQRRQHGRCERLCDLA